MDSRLIVIRKSALREEERDSQEDKNSSREAGVGSLTGILQGIQTSPADLSAVRRASQPLSKASMKTFFSTRTQATNIRKN